MKQDGERRNRIKGLILILRKITFAVQVFPFVYAALYIVVFALYNFLSGDALDILDALFYVSPIVIIAQIIYSYILKLCKWHRIACALPLIPQVINFIDAYIYEFTQEGLLVINISILIMIALYLVSAYKVFFTDNGRTC